MIKNYKCKAENFGKLQEYLFTKGYVWMTDSVRIINISIKSENIYIIVRENKHMTYTENYDAFSHVLIGTINFERLLKIKKLC